MIWKRPGEIRAFFYCSQPNFEYIENMIWANPVPFTLVPTSDSESFRDMPEGCTGLPLSGHPGSFGHQRRFHIHQGIDLYVPEGTPIVAVEDGEVVAIEAFTGPHANPPTPWWNDTWTVLVEGETGVVGYGEIIPVVEVGTALLAGDIVGHVTPVLRKDKGRPMSMLHLELYRHGVRKTADWFEGPVPEELRDPTEFLRSE
jgi:hypothetical protein